MTDLGSGPVAYAARPDGRNRRSARTKEAILFACRLRMKGGEFQPSMRACCRDAGVSIRSGFQHFVSVETLRHAALQDGGTVLAILERILPGTAEIFDAEQEKNIITAAVFGRL